MAKIENVSLSYIKGRIKVEVLFKEMTFHQLKDIELDQYYFFEANMDNKKNDVQLDVKVCLPINAVNRMNLKNNSGKIGSVSYNVTSNGMIVLKTIHMLSPDMVKKRENKYALNIVSDSKSIVNISYTLPFELYHQVIPHNLLTKEEARIKASQITDDILNGNFPKEFGPKNKKRKESINKTNTKNPQRSIKIWVARDQAFKRCEYCINLHTNNYCVVNKQVVQSNNACSRFFTPKVYLGGSVSPR